MCPANALKSESLVYLTTATLLYEATINTPKEEREASTSKFVEAQAAIVVGVEKLKQGPRTLRCPEKRVRSRQGGGGGGAWSC